MDAGLDWDVASREEAELSGGWPGLGMSLITPVACQVGVLNIIRIALSRGFPPVSPALYGPEGLFPVARSGLSRLLEVVRACRLVMPLRMRRISSTS